ncbi:ShlB/FhaC/HecB family hemolysin secretion/activation protein [Pseudomonas mandelii]|uniref:ShlB/FhaC/HecB family hemolysin secretion/activation protein n=1 Tax=Pseudomonas mandelii TaxID=75612 RepID=UPI00224A5AD8|nr:ShlB/FhaC/HecB family hemolysin secretion/activation protein [Pseudomonas mandelii]MCX2900009.1 ShlB/FhaC/HecB family hemolysin secretion/activation protein [Pseudomonas mandelii]
MPNFIRAVPRHPRPSSYLAASLLIGLSASPLYAAELATPGQEVLRQHQQQQRDLQQLQLEQRSRQLERGSLGAGPEVPIKSAGVAADERCWPLSGVRVGGATLIDRQALDRKISPLVMSCMGPSQINRLLAAITELYVQAGYIASRPYLSAPPAAGQSLDILVDEGYVEAIELADQSLPISLAGAFPGMLGKVLNLRDLEQGLDQLNRLRSFDLSADIVPGEQPGASRIILKPRTAGQSRWVLNLGLDNLGSARTGRDRSTSSLVFDSPLQLNDVLSVGFSDTLNHGDRFGRSVSLYYAVPYGYWTWSVLASHAEYRAPFKIGALRLQTDGTSDQFALRADRVLWRGQNQLLSANLQLAHKDVDSFVEDVRLAIQSPTLTVAEAGLNLFWLDSAIWNLDVNYAQGLRWFGADDDADRQNTRQPRAQFRKYRAGLGQWRNGQLGQQVWQWQSQLNVQYSQDPLPAIEQLLGTDDSAVRGYRLNSTSGATGAVWRNTLRLPLSTDQPLRITPRLSLDSGWIKPDRDAPSQRLNGAGLGVNFAWKNLQVDVDYQRSLNTPDGFRTEPAVWLMRVGLQI